MTTDKTNSSELPGLLVSTEWLSGHLDDPGLRIIDATLTLTFREEGEPLVTSGRAEWAREHIPGAVYVDINEELSDRHTDLAHMLPPPDQFAETMGRLGVGDGHRVVVYSAGRMWWATRLWWMFRVMGFDAVSVLDGGLRKWLDEDRPTTAEASEFPPAAFTATCRPEWVADRDAVMAAIGTSNARVINALWADHHSGEKNYGYARLGRIAGSLNLPGDDLLDADTNTFLPPDRLAARVADVVADRATPIIFYCGGGIAATLDAFCLTLLGYEAVSVYDGSLREWTRDPMLPMETDLPCPPERCPEAGKIQ
jgi:thiosulfate/3-mercaptopyruvate sulfurtransferase